MKQTPFIVLVMAFALGAFYLAGQFRGDGAAMLDSEQFAGVDERLPAEQERPFIAPEYLLRDFPNTDFASVDERMKGIEVDTDPKDAFGSRENRFRSVEDADISDEARMLIVSNGTDTKAYPYDALKERRILNDVFAERPIVILWCEDCDEPRAFNRRLPGGESHFRSAGVRIGSQPLMYDEHTESLWLVSEGIAGVYEGERLREFAATSTTFAELRNSSSTILVLER